MKIKFSQNPKKEYSKYRRSIYATKNIKIKDTFSNQNIKVIRPGKGLDPRYLSQLIGKKSKSKFSISEPISLKIKVKSLKKFDLPLLTIFKEFIPSLNKRSIIDAFGIKSL